MTPAIWPARLHHLRRDSPDPERLAHFYGELLGDQVDRLSADQWVVAGRERCMVVGRGASGAVPYFALHMQDSAHLEAFAGEMQRLGIEKQPCPSPLLGEGAFAVTDPDGRQLALGIAKSRSVHDGLHGRLQHFVCASVRLPEMIGFYRDRLGMLESDRVVEEGKGLAAAFLRSDPEHHSFAAFRAPESRADHHCYETQGWTDIRDWADRMAQLKIPLWWGPGRHGPGNNLFFMIEDPDGHKVEFSAELELMPAQMPYRTWPHEQRTLNLWGSAWMRS
jgi:catechol 2,3-dioxygenase